MTIVNPARDTWPPVQSAVLWVRLLTKKLHSAADLGLPCLTKATKMNAYLVSRSRHYLPHLSFPWVAHPNVTCNGSGLPFLFLHNVHIYKLRNRLDFAGVLEYVKCFFVVVVFCTASLFTFKLSIKIDSSPSLKCLQSFTLYDTYAKRRIGKSAFIWLSFGSFSWFYIQCYNKLPI